MLWRCGSILDPEYMKVISLVALDVVLAVWQEASFGQSTLTDRIKPRPIEYWVATWPCCSGVLIELGLYSELVAPIGTTSSRNRR